jgi:hypothetical protein
LEQLGHALGALIDEVAESKVDFLVKAAERDGFALEGGVFRPAQLAPRSFAVTRVEDLTSIDDRGRRIALIANDSPKDAIDGALELVASVCRTIVPVVRETAPAKVADLVALVKSTLEAVALGPAGGGDAERGDALVRNSLQRLAAAVADLGELRAPSPHHARLAVGAAVALAGFIAETRVEPGRGRSRATGRARRKGRAQQTD